MKNFYELSNENKSEYMKEFNKLEYVKNINSYRAPSLIVLFIGAIALGILEAIIEEGTNLQGAFDIVATITGFAFFLFTYASIKLSVSFIRWLKIKHKVDY